MTMPTRTRTTTAAATATTVMLMMKTNNNQEGKNHIVDKAVTYEYDIGASTAANLPITQLKLYCSIMWNTEKFVRLIVVAIQFHAHRDKNTHSTYAESENWQKETARSRLFY